MRWGASAPSRLGAMRRCGFDRIFRPDMLGVAPAHVRAYIGPGSAPEPRQVPRRLDGPVRRREQLQRQRHGSAGNGRVSVQAEQLLDADRQYRRLIVVADRNATAGGSIEMAGCKRAQLALK